MINLNFLKENQKFKAIFNPDIAFNSLQMSVYTKVIIRLSWKM